MGKINLSVNQDKADLKGNIKQAIADLDLIIKNHKSLTLEQARDAIGKLAGRQKKIIKLLAAKL